MTDWLDHWRLSRNPFGPGASPYVPTPTHDEAVARLVDAVANRERSAVLRATAGLGKSVVLERVLSEVRSPRRRIVRLTAAGDGTTRLAVIAERFGIRVSSGAARSETWRALGDAVRLARWQRLQIVCAIDDCQTLTQYPDLQNLEHLRHLDPHADSCLTVLQAFQVREDDGESPPAWQLAIRLVPLSRMETEAYLRHKLAAAGRDEPVFTARGLDRLHALAGGNPRGLDRLAGLGLRAAAWRALEMITPDVLEGVARECFLPTYEFAPVG
jgi:type II secretory pathway predicted ATPase ExeA